MRKVLTILIIVFACLAVFSLTRHFQNKNVSSVSNKVVNPPARIVSLTPDITEILFAMGLNEKIVAVSSDSDFPPQTAGKKKTGTFWQPNTEAVIACKPDLVITQWFPQQKAVADTLSKIGYKVLTLKMETIEELLCAIEKIGDVADCRNQADELKKNINEKLNALRTKIGSADKVKVLWVLQIEPLRVAGRNTFINELIELSGGENAIGPTLQQYPPLSSEEVLASGTEVIIQSAMETAELNRQQESANVFWSKFASLPAVKNNRIYVVDPDTILRLGPRLPQGAELIARCVHPEIFKKSSEADRSR
jgi:iron complex transport system substrate-binding protein